MKDSLNGIYVALVLLLFVNAVSMICLITLLSKLF